VVRLALLIVPRVVPLRATAEQEASGLNVVEHGVRSELQVVCDSLEQTFAHPTLSFTADSAANSTLANVSLPTDQPGAQDDAGRLVATYTGLIERLSEESKIAAYAESQEARGRDLEQQRAFLRTVLDAIVAAVAILDRDGEIVETNRAWMHLRFPIADGARCVRKGENFFAALDGSTGTDAAELAEACRGVLDGDSPSHDDLHSLRGEPGPGGEPSKTWLQARVTPLPGDASDRVIVMLFDVTKRVEAERKAVRASAKAEMLNDAVESNQRVLRLAMEAARLSTWHWDVNSGHLEWSPEWPQTLGYTPSELRPDMQTIESLTHADDLPIVQRAIAEHFASTTNRLECDYRTRTSDGSFRWTRMVGRIVSRDDEGRPSLVAGVWSDIDDQKANEQRAASLARVMEELPNEAMILDAESGRFIEINAVARDRLGYSLPELRGRDATGKVFELESEGPLTDLAGASGGAKLRRKDGTA
ncbi:MAG: PAS domain S-box protein, partial [Planctomycetota bacterium]